MTAASRIAEWVYVASNKIPVMIVKPCLKKWLNTNALDDTGKNGYKPMGYDNSDLRVCRRIGLLRKFLKEYCNKFSSFIVFKTNICLRIIYHKILCVNMSQINLLIRMKTKWEENIVSYLTGNTFFLCKKWKLLSCVWLFATLWTITHQAPLSMGFSTQEYWNGLPCSPPGTLPNPGIKPRSPAWQADSFTTEPAGKPLRWWVRK